jgi:hypothetical protein
VTALEERINDEAMRVRDAALSADVPTAAAAAATVASVRALLPTAAELAALPPLPCVALQAHLLAVRAAAVELQREPEGGECVCACVCACRNGVLSRAGRRAQAAIDKLLSAAREAVTEVGALCACSVCVHDE